MMITHKLDTSEYSPYYKSYIDKATNVDIVNGLTKNLISVCKFYEDIDSKKHDYSYADEKWSIKDILLHIIDTERIFSYRALRITRGDNTPMVGFDQDDYVITGRASTRSMKSLIEEYANVRQSTISLFSNINDNELLLKGKASGSEISVRAIGYIISGHENHHNQIIRERYL